MCVKLYGCALGNLQLSFWVGNKIFCHHHITFLLDINTLFVEIGGKGFIMGSISSQPLTIRIA